MKFSIFLFYSTRRWGWGLKKLCPPKFGAWSSEGTGGGVLAEQLCEIGEASSLWDLCKEQDFELNEVRDGERMQFLKDRVISTREQV